MAEEGVCALVAGVGVGVLVGRGVGAAGGGDAADDYCVGLAVGEGRGGWGRMGVK